MADKEFKIGTWVEFTNNDNQTFTGFIISLGAKKCRVLWANVKYKDQNKQSIIIKTMHQQVADHNYEILTPIDSIELTEDDVRSLIDISLDLKDEELFYFWSEELNVMLEQDLPVLIK